MKIPLSFILQCLVPVDFRIQLVHETAFQLSSLYRWSSHQRKRRRRLLEHLTVHPPPSMFDMTGNSKKRPRAEEEYSSDDDDSIPVDIRIPAAKKARLNKDKTASFTSFFFDMFWKIRRETKPPIQSVPNDNDDDGSDVSDLTFDTMSTVGDRSDSDHDDDDSCSDSSDTNTTS